MKKVSTNPHPTKRLKIEKLPDREPGKKSLDLILQFAGSYCSSSLRGGERVDFFMN